MIYLQKQATTLEGIDYLKRAIESDRWIEGGSATAREMLAETLIRTGSLQEAREQLAPLVGAERSGSRVAVSYPCEA